MQEKGVSSPSYSPLRPSLSPPFLPSWPLSPLPSPSPRSPSNPLPISYLISFVVYKETNFRSGCRVWSSWEQFNHAYPLFQDEGTLLIRYSKPSLLYFLPFPLLPSTLPSFSSHSNYIHIEFRDGIPIQANLASVRTTVESFPENVWQTSLYMVYLFSISFIFISSLFIFSLFTHLSILFLIKFFLKELAGCATNPFRTL